jgi:threonine/homoserine/homoserine lactone efflux protein
VLEYILFGGGFGFAAAAQPGPFQAFLLSRVAASGWRRTLPAALAPLLSDGPIALAVLLVLGRMPHGAVRALHAAGGLLLLYLAFSAYRGWRRTRAAGIEERGSVPRTLLQAAAVNILNPNPYLGWSLVLGPAALKAWARGPANAVALLASFYGTLVTCTALLILLMGTTQALGPRGRRTLVLVSAVTLAALGVWQLASSLR